MKTKIGTYKPRTSIRIRMGDIVNLEMVLMRHITREFKRRNNDPRYLRPLQRMDVRDAIRALRTIKESPMEVSYNVE